MSDVWYYVQNGERQGPVEFSKVSELYEANILKEDDYVWCKGMENWQQIKDTEDFKNIASQSAEQKLPDFISVGPNSFSLATINANENILFIKIGADRGGVEVEYGPYSLLLVQKLYKENRINAKTFLYSKGMDDWTVLADVQGFEQVFDEVPPKVEEHEKRASVRKPFVARMFIQNRSELYEGICRDISIGGMQVLVNHFPVDTGERININVHPENSNYHFVASGVVVRKLEGGQGFSFRFTDLDENAKRAIDSYIN